MQQVLATLWKRVVWTTFFAAFLALEVIMSRHMASNQPVLFGIVILAAVVSAVAFVYSRTNKEALLIAVLGVSVHVFCSASYWSSVIDDIAIHAAREQAAASARDVVSAKRKERYASSASGKGVAQLAAEIEALQLNDRWRTSAGCSDATAEISKAFCREYFAKKADLEAAREASSLETTVWNTTVETVDVPRNLAKGALFVATLTGMSVQAATNLLVLAFVAFTQTGLALSLRVGYAPEKRKEAAVATKDEPISLATIHPVIAAVERPARSELHPVAKITGVMASPPPMGEGRGEGNVRGAEHLEKFAETNVANVRETTKTEHVATDVLTRAPDQFREAAQKVQVQAIGDIEPMQAIASSTDDTTLATQMAEAFAEPLVDSSGKVIYPEAFNPSDDEDGPPTKPRGKKKLNAKDKRALDWLRSSVMGTKASGAKLTAKQIYQAYALTTTEEDRVSQKKLTILFTAEVAEQPREAGKRAERNNAGSVFWGYELVSPNIEKKRARA